MQKFLNQFVFVSSIVVIGTVFGEVYDPSPHFAASFKSSPPQPPCPPELPQHRPRMRECLRHDFTVFANFLYWRPELDGLEPAFGTTHIAQSSNGLVTTTVVTETDEHPDFRWSSGYRLGADYVWDRFEITSFYTNFHGHAKFKKKGQYGGWKINYQTVDLLFGGWFKVAPYFYIEPFIGLRYAKIHHRLKSALQISYAATLPIGDNTLFMNKHDKESFWGLGPEIGLNIDWVLARGFSLYGNIDIITYHGHLQTTLYDVDILTQIVSISKGKIKRSFSGIGTDLALGVRWDLYWDMRDKTVLHFMLCAGLEQHQIYDFSNLGSDGTLSLHGAVAGAEVGFLF